MEENLKDCFDENNRTASILSRHPIKKNGGPQPAIQSIKRPD
jgi:hypothetical protein